MGALSGYCIIIREATSHGSSQWSLYHYPKSLCRNMPASNDKTPPCSLSIILHCSCVFAKYIKNPFHSFTKALLIIKSNLPTWAIMCV